ncbi:MAG: GNAT family N-acetyltransferase [Firmicutes bacterium]|nr:GNAT family N-acetyltransferase [Bacillota bacterium]
MNERIIRRLVPEDMPAYMEIYLNAYPAGKDLSDECYEKYYNRNLQSMTVFDHVNFYGMFEDGQLIATMKLIDFDMNLFGQMRRSTGLMALGVHPLHKRKGAARDMVKFFEEYTVESGGCISMLLPFRMDFYKKLGYGCGTKLDEYHIKTEYLPDIRDRHELAGLRLLRRDEADAALECYTEFVKQNHGAVCKFEEEVRDFRDDDEVRRLGWFEEGKLTGYAAFTFENTSDCNYTLNRMNVKELVYHDAAVLRKLLAGLRMQADLAQSVVVRSGEPDFYHVLASCQDMSGGYIDFGFLQTNVSAVGTMYKICDFGKFFEVAAHREFPVVDLTAGFDVTDDVTGETERFAVQFAGGKWAYQAGGEAYDTAEVHVTCRRSDLSSLFMGSAEFGGLVRLGVMTVDKPEFVRTLDLLLHAEQKPFTNTDY